MPSASPFVDGHEVCSTMYGAVDDLCVDHVVLSRESFYLKRVNTHVYEFLLQASDLHAQSLVVLLHLLVDGLQVDV